MTTTVSLVGVQIVRRQDSYSLAARALFGRALGGKLGEDLRLGPFSADEQPSAHVMLPGNTEEELCFILGWVALPWVLERFDEDQTLGEHGDYWLDDILDGDWPMGERVQKLAGDLSDGPESLIEIAWEQVHAFFVREWATIETIASRLRSQRVVPRSEIPVRPWEPLFADLPEDLLS